MHAWCPWRPEESVRSPETGVTDDCEPPVWVLGMKSGFFARAANALDCWATLLGSHQTILKTMLPSQKT